MENPYLRLTFLSAFFLSVIISGCKKTSTPASTVNLASVATTNVVVNLTSTTAQSGGVILSEGNGIITQNGVCYSATNKTPTTADGKTSDPVSTSGKAILNITSNLTGLTANTTYYVRAYAVNAAGTAYGGVIQFTTSASLSAINAAVTTFAGNGTAGYLDAMGLSAQFNNPQGVSVDSKGGVYVSDGYSLIREITPAGAVTTVAGGLAIGYTDGAAATAQFYGPAGSAFDAQGNLYIADAGNNIIRKITPSGVVSTYAGTGLGGYRNGAATSANLTGKADSSALFNSPQGVAVDASGNVYVADRGNSVIRKITTAGRVVTVAGAKSKGFIDATGESAAFNNPSGIVLDSQGNMYVTDQGNSALRKITSAGVVTTIVGNPSQTFLLNYPSAITIDKTGNLYIADESGRVLEFATNNSLYVLAGTSNVAGFVNGTNAAALFSNPQGIAIDANGNIYVADQNNNCIRKVTVTLVP
jgi:sugar lactone lactonase YvrE